MRATLVWLAVLLTGCSGVSVVGNDQSSSNTSAPAPAGATGVAKVDAAYLTSGGNGSDWAATGYNYQEQRFSPLAQIDASNVGRLGLAWSADLPDARGMEATPIVIDGKLFVTGPWSKVFAFDVLTGKPLWTYDPQVDKAKGVQACCDVVNRGVAAWKGRLYLGTLDGRLIALDATTGKPDWTVQTTDNTKPYTITGAPRVVKDMVLIGNGGAEFGVRGYVTAYDAATGAKKWRFYTVPNPTGAADGEPSDAVLKAKAGSTWSANGQWKQSGGGGTVWDAIVYDAELDQLYIGVGNGNPWNHGLRSEGKGDNLFLSSVVALKPETGEYLWHYQETPAESWDFTATQPIILATLPIAGKPTKVLMQAPKNGFFFVIDRTNGHPLAADKFVNTVNWADRYGADGRPVETAAARYYRTQKPFVGIPSALAAHNWQPMSFSPKTGLVYIPAQEVGLAYIPPVHPQDSVRQPVGFNVGLDLGDGMLPHDPAAIAGAQKATVGALVAWDPVARKPRWRVQISGAVERRHDGDRGQSGVPGHRARRFPRLCRGYGEAVVQLPGPVGGDGGGQHLHRWWPAICRGDDRARRVLPARGGLCRRRVADGTEHRPRAGVQAGRHREARPPARGDRHRRGAAAVDRDAGADRRGPGAVRPQLPGLPRRERGGRRCHPEPAARADAGRCGCVEIDPDRRRVEGSGHGQLRAGDDPGAGGIGAAVRHRRGELGEDASGRGGEGAEVRRASGFVPNG